MACLSLSLLGSIEVTLAGQPVAAFGYDKVQALLVYLAVEADQPHRRESLAGLLWPELSESRAHHNLSQALFRLRWAIGDRQATPPFLIITRQALQFNPASDYCLDVTDFRRLLAVCQAHPHPRLAACDACLERLAGALALYRGDFLAGFSLADCPRFEWWQLTTQEVCHRQALEALSLLIHSYEAKEDYARVSHYACRQTELEPWRESAYRRGMRALALSGKQGEALRQYDTCREQLSREMGIEPSAETTRLYQQIRARALPGLRRPPAEPPLPSPGLASDRIAASGPFNCFVGREAELATLNGGLAEALSGRGRALFVAGEAGSGKTLLLREFTRRGLDAHPHLLVAGDRCDGRLGSGRPYQPFVGLLAALSGGGDLHRPTPDEVIAGQARRLAAPGYHTGLQIDPGQRGCLRPSLVYNERVQLFCNGMNRKPRDVRF